MADREHSWKPKGGTESVWIEAEDRTPLPRTTLDRGVRNGMPEWKPYVRDPAIRARELEVEAMLEAVRARIRDEIDGGEAPK